MDFFQWWIVLMVIAIIGWIALGYALTHSESRFAVEVREQSQAIAKSIVRGDDDE